MFLELFIKENEELINSGNIRTVLNRCPRKYRQQLIDVFKEIGLEVTAQFKQYSNRELRGHVSKIVGAIIGGCLKLFNNKGLNGRTYKWWGVYGLTKDFTNAENYIKQELDKLQVEYDYVKVERTLSSGHILTNITIRIPKTCVID